jgi:hypothetical protein
LNFAALARALVLILILIIIIIKVEKVIRFSPHYINPSANILMTRRIVDVEQGHYFRQVL